MKYMNFIDRLEMVFSVQRGLSLMPEVVLSSLVLQFVIFSNPVFQSMVFTTQVHVIFNQKSMKCLKPNLIHF